MRWLDSVTNSMDMNLTNSGRQWRTGKPGVLQFMGSQRVRHDLVTEHTHTHTHTHTRLRSLSRLCKWPMQVRIPELPESLSLPQLLLRSTEHCCNTTPVSSSSPKGKSSDERLFFWSHTKNQELIRSKQNKQRLITVKLEKTVLISDELESKGKAK